MAFFERSQRLRLLRTAKKGRGVKAGAHKTVKEPLSFLWNLSDGVGNNIMSDAWFTD